MTEGQRPARLSGRCIYRELDAARLEMGLTQTELAKRVGLCSSSFRKRCAGAYPFTWKERMRLSEITGIPEERLFQTDAATGTFQTKKQWVFPNLQAEAYKRKVTYKQMEEVLHLSGPAISLYLLGRARMPLAHKQKLHAAFFPNINFVWLFYRDEDLARERMEEAEDYIGADEREEVKLILTLLDALARAPGRVRRPALENAARMIQAALEEE